jgi:hypothetical protein
MSEEQTAIVKQEQKTVMNYGKLGVQLASLDEAYRFAKYVVAAGFAPRGLEKPESVLIAMQHGAELGMTPMQALQSIAIVNGRPSIYGDAALALVRGSGLCEKYSQTTIGTGDDRKAVVYTKRVDGSEVTSEFSIGDAKRAGLWGKAGPWSQYPERMLLFRARGFNLRDNFGDVLKGLRTTEELQDIPMRAVEGSDVFEADVGNEDKPKKRKLVDLADDLIKKNAKEEAKEPVIETKEAENPQEVAPSSPNYDRQDIESLIGNMPASKLMAAFDTVGLSFEEWPFKLSDDEAKALKNALTIENNKNSKRK